ncbi:MULTISPECIES: TetR/AcrR family transcriptional regulator [unclassified Streptomyces]|uniref:TetR/AcrR family transcriptional regulator n=1 Tax=unclassified Streptomyces TaxID=2593676 RepID=UPI00036CAB52|nr:MULTISPECIES: TetR/AcrR family transcriptional regulator [unclassified Streptomyces]MYQ77546.1 TetR family transcriptional regulator [Streptomyces sp. SID4923]WUD00657.1 TetR/AcrR family transcriptional regulator [Streptomyces sp. NBC_00523]
MAHNASESRPSEARDRLLSTATRIFYSEGIHSVGVDRIVKEAQVTRATFYRHFPSKENLVVAYLTEADRALRGQAEAAIAAGLPAPDTLRAIGASIAQAIESPGFRGCAFLNAVAEYPDPADPVHQVVLAHRQWFLDTLTGLLRTIREEPADRAARHFVMLRDGAMAAGCLFDPELVSETFLNGVEGLLKAQATASFT